MYLIPIPAFTDNYLWLLHDGRRAMVVDPGDAEPVFRVLEQFALELDSILVTHHHADHAGGVDALRKATGARVYGPATEHIPEPFEPLREGDTVHTLGMDFRVIDVPGHTSGHVAFFTPEMEGKPLLFCGDILFSGGCGRLFEGTPAQMQSSLGKLAALPGPTQVCSAHEYTLGNLRFALAVEPGNKDLMDYEQHCQELRRQGQPTLPSSIRQEMLINPFLRTRQLAVAAAVRRFSASSLESDAEVFAAMRQWKNQFN